MFISKRWPAARSSKSIAYEDTNHIPRRRLLVGSSPRQPPNTKPSALEPVHSQGRTFINCLTGSSSDGDQQGNASASAEGSPETRHQVFVEGCGLRHSHCRESEAAAVFGVIYSGTNDDEAGRESYCRR